MKADEDRRAEKWMEINDWTFYTEQLMDERERESIMSLTSVNDLQVAVQMLQSFYYL